MHVAPAEVEVVDDDGFPRIVPVSELPPLSDEELRDTIESTRTGAYEAMGARFEAL